MVKYCDFNVSSVVKKMEEVNVGFLGTRMYAPPELMIQTNNIVSPFATDVWCLGVTLLEVANGRHPFADKNLQQIEDSLKEEMVIPDEINPRLGELLKQMLDLDWRKRPTVAQI